MPLMKILARHLKRFHESKALPPHLSRALPSNTELEAQRKTHHNPDSQGRSHRCPTSCQERYPSELPPRGSSPFGRSQIQHYSRTPLSRISLYQIPDNSPRCVCKIHRNILDRSFLKFLTLLAQEIYPVSWISSYTSLKSKSLPLKGIIDTWSPT